MRLQALPVSLTLALAWGAGCGGTAPSRPDNEQAGLKNDGTVIGPTAADSRSEPVDKQAVQKSHGNAIVAIAAGSMHTCALTAAGGVKCWGANQGGQLGDGTTDQRPEPTDVKGLTSGVTAIAAGGGSTCALTSAGGVLCWGRNIEGQLGDASAPDRLEPTEVKGLESGIVAITASWSHACALTTGGAVRCWGDNRAGQIGDGSRTTLLEPTDVKGLASGVTAIAAGGEHTCALTTGGGVVCWGRNFEGQLGDASTTGRLEPTEVKGLASGVTAIAAGSSHTCALTTAGGVRCWGENGAGELGDGDTSRDGRPEPADVKGLASGVTAIAAGTWHTCALTTVGGVRCWGSDGGGTHLSGDEPTWGYGPEPANVKGLESGVAAITAGHEYTCALTIAGSVLCWGDNQGGQLGDGTAPWRSEPADVKGLKNGIAAIAAGGIEDVGAPEHTCALTTAGAVKCWGRNFWNQLGDGTREGQTVPVDVTGLTRGIAAIAAGGVHTCALTMAGGVKCWGDNKYGQTGNESTTCDLPEPTDVGGLTRGAAAITAGFGHTCALTTAGGVKCWGDNGVGQLGNGRVLRGDPPRINSVEQCHGVVARAFINGVEVVFTPDAPKRKDVRGLERGVTAIAAGHSHTCALTTTGAVKCWGYNKYGQIGDGTRYNASKPKDVKGLTVGVAAIAAGTWHTCALTTAGAVKCWGDNDEGQLGDGSTTNRSEPADVKGLASGVVAIAAGNSYTCALTTTGAVKCWGTNEEGQLGDGSTTNRSEPADVKGLENGIAAIAAGNSHTCAVTTAGGVKCWGRNRDGQLGDGYTTWRPEPMKVMGLTDNITDSLQE